MKFSATQRLGRAIEAQVCSYLMQRGLKLVVANYNCRVGEIDLVMQDRDSLVFVEVRYRQDDDYGGALESITKSKRRKIVCAAKYYLLEHDLWEKAPCRFDVVIVRAGCEQEKIVWLKDAFWAKY